MCDEHCVRVMLFPTMKDTQSKEGASLEQRLASWPSGPGRWFEGSRDLKASQVEPVHRPPAPAAFDAPAMLSSVRPDPLLLVTPERSLGHARLAAHSSGPGELPASDAGGAARRGRTRVHFAPGTRTTPPRNANTDSADSSVGTGGCDEDCVPRSFSTVGQKLYHPGLYADTEREVGATVPALGACAPASGAAARRCGVERRGGVERRATSAVPVSTDRSAGITSEYCAARRGQPVAATVIKHRPLHAHSSLDTEAWVSDRQARQVFRSPSPARKTAAGPARSASASPTHSQRSSARSSPATSPIRPRSSPAASPGRGSPIAVGGPQYLTSHGNHKHQTAVKVIREAPLRPKHDDYVFPFHSDSEGRREYDSNFENPLARPEFNSALKISEELKSARAKRPDTWATVSDTLSKSETKRTQIQEKVTHCFILVISYYCAFVSLCHCL